MSESIHPVTLNADPDLIAATTDIVIAFLSGPGGRVGPEDIAGVIKSVHGALNELTAPAANKPETYEPAVSVRASIKATT